MPNHYLLNTYLPRLQALRSKVQSYPAATMTEEKLSELVNGDLRWFLLGTKNQLKKLELTKCGETNFLFTMEFLNKYLLSTISDKQVKDFINGDAIPERDGQEADSTEAPE